MATILTLPMVPKLARLFVQTEGFNLAIFNEMVLSLNQHPDNYLHDDPMIRARKLVDWSKRHGRTDEVLNLFLDKYPEQLSAVNAIINGG